MPKVPLWEKEPKKEGRVIRSLTLALGTDCGDSCDDVSERCVENQTKTQHICIIASSIEQDSVT